ncbi:LPXTG cell wall anchor domain-containing protein [Streptococcus suis]|uniref:LPXTG cell wall anchor domain-containing protein n=1 Tax=Streptococcus suis TaxID=1307 RepID=UPI0038B829F9
MQVKKFAKWGLALTSTLVLGGAIAPVGNQLLGGSAVVYAQDGAVFEPYVVEFYIDGEYWGVANRGYNSGWPYVRLEPYSEEFPGKEWPSEELGGFTSNLPNVSVVTKEDLDSIGSVVKVYWTRKPVETLPVEQPAEQPISVAVIAISESDGPLSHYYVTIKPGETKTVETPKVDGYKLDQHTSPTYELTYDNALKQLNSAGFAWVQFWMIKDAAPETPVETPVEKPAETPTDQPTEKPATTPTEKPVEKPADQPTEQPAEQPAEQPVEIKPAETLTAQPVDQPAEKPVEQPAETSTAQPVETPTDQPTEQPAETPTDQPTDQPATTPIEQPVEQPADQSVKQPSEKPTATSLLAGNTASKAQPVVTTDKNSTPSTNTVKPEEGSQATAKTLPKTGDSSSMHLVLGGFLSGLSGLGLAAPSRKRD